VTHHPKAFAAVVLGLFLAGGIITGITPQAAAFEATWQSPTGGGAFDENVQTVGSGNYYSAQVSRADLSTSVLFAESSGPQSVDNALRVWKCTNTNCPLLTSFGTNVRADNGSSMASVPGTTFSGICYSDGTTTPILKAQFSSNSGVSWTTATELATGPPVARHCGIGGSSSTNWVVTHRNGITGTINFFHTTDAGSSWTSSAAIETVASSGRPENASVLVRNASDWTVLYRNSVTGALRSCDTTDAGAAWSCASLNTGVIHHRAYLDHASGTHYGASIRPGGVTNFYSSSDGVAWDQFTVPTGTSSDRAVDVVRESNADYRFLRSQSSSGKGSNASVSQTLDGGATWSTFALAITEAGTTATSVSDDYPHGGGAIAIVGSLTYVAWSALDPHGPAPSPSRFDLQFRIRYTLGADADTTTLSVETLVTGGTIVGADMHFIGRTLLIRVNDPGLAPERTRMFSLNGLTLDTLGTEAGLIGCDNLDGVFAWDSDTKGDHVAFLSCSDPDEPLDITHLSVRSASMGDPNWASNCLNDYCTRDIPLDGAFNEFEAENDWHEVGEIDAFPIDGTSTFGPGFNTCGLFTPFTSRCTGVGWTAGIADGRIGAFVKMFRDDESDFEHETFAATGSSIQPTEMCTTREGWKPPTESRTLLLGAMSVSAPRIWTLVTPTNQATTEPPGFTSDNFRWILRNQLSAANLAYSVDCSPFWSIWAKSDTVWVYNTTTGAQHPQWLNGVSRTAITSGRNVAMSYDGEFAAYQDTATTLRLVDVDTADTLGTLTHAGDEIVGMWITGTGQYLTVATGAAVTVYTIYPFTTGVPVPIGGTGEQPTTQEGLDDAEGGTVPPPPTTAPGTGIFQNANNAFSALGVGAEAGGWIWGIALTSGLAVGFFFVGGPALAVLGGLLGLGLSVAFGFIPLWFIFVLAAVGVAVGIAFTRR